MAVETNSDNKSKKRVVITGVGLLTPAGGTFGEYWEAITAGRSALRPISRVDTKDLNFSIGGEVDDSFFKEGERPKELEEMDRAVLLCQTATRRALQDSGLNLSEIRQQQIGIILGTGAGPSQSMEDGYVAFARGGARAVPPRTVTRSMFNSVSAHVGIALGLTGPQFTVTAACASANIAMSRAVDLIRYGNRKLVVTGGVEMPLCPGLLSSWSAMRVCSRATDSEQCCLPFDKRRGGLVLAEGAAMFLFEELTSARARGAQIYAEVLGYGESNDATHITQPDSQSQSIAINRALADAEVSHRDVGYINAHGTGTKLNDLCETEAIKRSFGEFAPRIPISSTKPVIGHALGASGALELPAVLGAFRHQALPPTANLREPDPQCDLDYVPCKAREGEVKIALSNSFAFGGANSVLVLGAFNPGE